MIPWRNQIIQQRGCAEGAIIIRCVQEKQDSRKFLTTRALKISKLRRQPIDTEMKDRKKGWSTSL